SGRAERAPQAPPDHELPALFAAPPTWRDRTLTLVQWVSRLRILEAVAVRFDEVECSHKRIHIHTSKNRDARAISMTDETFTALNRSLDHERAALERAGAIVDEEAIFLAFRGPNRSRQICVNALHTLLVYYAAKRAVPHTHTHLLRQTGVTRLLAAGMPEAAVRALVGRTSASSWDPFPGLPSAATLRAGVPVRSVAAERSSACDRDAPGRPSCPLARRAQRAPPKRIVQRA